MSRTTCICGRSLIERPGDAGPTCGECRCPPSACRCAPVPGAVHAPDDLAGLARLASLYEPVNWHDAWKAQPDHVEWLIEPFLEVGTINVLFGAPGTGKSLLALEIALQLARNGRTVCYVDEENRVVDLVERLQAFGAAPDGLDRLRAYSFASLPPLDTAEGGLHLLALAATAGADLVVLDTTSRMIKGGENDADTFLQLYRHSMVPLKARGITALRLDHPGKDADRGQRGSSAKDGDVDTVWRIKATSPTVLRFDRLKSRNGHGEGTAEVHRRFEPLRHEWNDQANPVVLEVAGQLAELGVPANAGRPAARKALDAAGIKASNAHLEAAVRLRKSGHTPHGQARQTPAGDTAPGSTRAESHRAPKPQVNGDSTARGQLPGSRAAVPPTDCPPAPPIGAGSRAAPTPGRTSPQPKGTP